MRADLRTSLFATLALAGAARADRGESYAMAAITPMVQTIREPGAGSSVRAGAGLELSLLQGIDNQLHLGAALHLGGARNARFNPASATGPDGSALSGELFEDAWQFGAAFAAAWRFDWGGRWAPVARADLGLSLRSYSNRVLLLQWPARTPPLGAAVAGQLALAPGGRLGLSMQRRLGDEWALEAGVAVRAELGSRGSLQLQCPLTLARIF